MSQLLQSATQLPTGTTDSSTMVSDTKFVLITYFVMVAIIIITCVVLICSVCVNLINKYNELKSDQQ